MDASTPFGRYVLKERLAQGGMGEVFRAVAVGERGFEKPVVVKRILPAHAGREDLAELFVAEAKLMTRLAHPNIVEVYDFGRGEHRDYYLVLELVDGVDLGRLARAFVTRGERFPEPLALFIAAQVLRGLHHAHTRLASEGVVVVHRDVSPSNVLLSTEGEVKVADFGVALVQRELRPGGGVAGKPGYMAPEQFDGRAIDARADVFSTGVVLHQLLAGRPPFGGDTAEAQQVAAARGQRDPLSIEAIERIVARALAPDPDARWPSARAMAQAIEALRDEGRRIAGADDVADAVRDAQRDLPVEARRVIALGSAPSAAVDEAPRELTRAGGAFTLRLPVRADATTRQVGEPATRSTGGHTLDRYAAPEPRTEAIAPHERAPLIEPAITLEPRAAPSPTPADSALRAEAPPAEQRSRSRAARWAAIALLVPAAGLALFAARGGARAPVAAPIAPSASVMEPSASVMPSASAIAPAASTIAPAVSAAPSPSITSTPRGAAPRSSAITAAASAVPATPSAAPDDGCTGTVHFSSTTSWDVRGGPTPTQTPGDVVWRCGTYGLTLRDRHDPTRTRAVTVQVRADRTARVDLTQP